jgi:hypothetical protein
MTIINSILRFAVSIILLPVCYAVGRSLIDMVLSINKSADIRSSWTYFLCGFITYIIFQIVFSKPIRTYIFGHELTHAIASIILGGRIKSFKVRKTGGSVTLTKTNLFITLAPYFVPIYTLLFIVAYWAIKQIFGINTHYRYFLFIFGFTIALHLSLTAFAIKQEQSDLKRYGVIYSLILIFILNCIILSLILVLLFSMRLTDFSDGTIKYTRDAFITIYKFAPDFISSHL